jgi:hypothetical protein
MMTHYVHSAQNDLATPAEVVPVLFASPDQFAGQRDTSRDGDVDAEPIRNLFKVKRTRRSIAA